MYRANVVVMFLDDLRPFSTSCGMLVECSKELQRLDFAHKARSFLAQRSNRLFQP